MDAVQLNEQLDAELLATGIVSRELYLRLAEAYGYGAASTVGWIEGRLAVLAKRVASGRSAVLYAPAADQPLPCRSLEELKAWAAELFPGVAVAGE